MVEPEIAFAELDDVMDLAEDMTCHIVRRVLDGHPEELKALGRDTTILEKVAKPFPRITYSEAVELLHSPAVRERLEAEMDADRRRLREAIDELDRTEREAAAAGKSWQQEQKEGRIRELREEIHDLEQEVQSKPEHIRLAQGFAWGKDLGGSDETIISRQFDRPVFVTDYPREAKAFYMKVSATDARVVRNCDLLAPEGYGEIIGGSQREEDPGKIVENMKAKGLRPEDYDWYLDLRRYGSVPHGGFGLGVERMMTWLCGLKHVRETIPFPRTLGRLRP